jgi:glycosyltransferase involved in cell wall biosynthesis
MPILMPFITIANPFELIAIAGQGPFSLGITEPTDLGGPSLTVTIDSLPSYGTVQYFNGSGWINVTLTSVLTPSELASARYAPPTSGEDSGGTFSYTVSDGNPGAPTATGTMNVTVIDDTNGFNNLYFSAVGPGASGPDLYVLDSNGVVTAAPIRSDAQAALGSYAGENGGYVQFGNTLYFFASTGTGDVLFSLGQNGLVTPVSDGNGGTYGDPGEDVHFTVFDGSLYFEAISSTGGDQLVKLNSDGTSQTIVLNPGGEEAFPGQNGGFTAFDGSLYFSAITQTTNGFNPDLIKLNDDGTWTEISTRSLANAQFGSLAGEDGGFFVYNSALYFNAFSDTFGETLFKLAAGSDTPVAVDPTGSVLSHEDGVPSAFHEFNGDLYFNELSDTLANDTLFQLDAAGNLTALSFNGEALQNAGAIGGFADFAGSTYFVATTTSDGAQLFKLDTGGTISEIAPNSNGDSFDNNIPAGFLEFAGSLYFDANDSSFGDGLFKLDADGTLTEVFTTLGMTDAANLAIYDGNLYFSAWTNSGNEFVELHADGTSQVVDINTDPGQSGFPGANGGFANFAAAPCYCRGTLIETEAGDRPVEALEIGDKVRTASGVLRPIKWIGRRGYAGRFVKGRKHLLPICLKAGSLNKDLPRRDLWISPHHAMYLQGALIEARFLVNGASVVQAEAVDSVEYFHIELETHDVILAEGAPSESFVDDNSRGMFHNAHEFVARYPDRPRGPPRYCAPRPYWGDEIAAARRHIALRAGIPFAANVTARAAAPAAKPQALVIDSQFPRTGHSGGANAILDHVRALQNAGFEVSFLASLDVAAAPAQLSDIGIRPLLPSLPGAVEDVMAQHAGQFDLVYLHRIENATACLKLARKYFDAQLVYSVADLHHVRLKAQSEVECDPDRSRQLMYNARAVACQEIMAAHDADDVITHSASEAEILRSLPSLIGREKVHVVPWAVPVDAVRKPFRERSGLAFIGSFGHEPNADAARFLVDDVMPLVWRDAPDIKCLLVGGGLSEDMRRKLEVGGVEILGRVDDLADVFERVRLTVAPLRFGAGVKDKVIRSLGAGLPCVGTPEAFSGMAELPATIVRDCVGQSARELAAAIVALHRDPAKNANCAQAGLDYVATVFNAGRIDALMRRLVQPALGRRRGKPSRFGSEVVTVAFGERSGAQPAQAERMPDRRLSHAATAVETVVFEDRRRRLG